MTNCRRQDNSPKEISRDYKADREFHQYLLRCSENSVLITFSRLLQIFFSHFIDENVEDSELATSDHEILVYALEKNNLELARGAMREHLSKYYKLLEERKLKNAGNSAVQLKKNHQIANK